MKFAAAPENETHSQGQENLTRERKPRTKRVRATGPAAGTKRRRGRPSTKGMARSATSAGQTAETQTAGTQIAGTQTIPWMQNGGTPEALMDLGINSAFDLTAPNGATLRIGNIQLTTSGAFRVSRIGVKA